MVVLGPGKKKGAIYEGRKTKREIVNETNKKKGNINNQRGVYSKQYLFHCIALPRG